MHGQYELDPIESMIDRLVVDQIPYIPQLNFRQTGSGEERYGVRSVHVPVSVGVAGEDRVVSGSIASRHYVRVVLIVVDFDGRGQDRNGALEVIDATFALSILRRRIVVTPTSRPISSPPPPPPPRKRSTGKRRPRRPPGARRPRGGDERDEYDDDDGRAADRPRRSFPPLPSLSAVPSGISPERPLSSPSPPRSSPSSSSPDAARARTRART